MTKLIYILAALLGLWAIVDMGLTRDNTSSEWGAITPDMSDAAQPVGPQPLPSSLGSDMLPASEPVKPHLPVPSVKAADATRDDSHVCRPPRANDPSSIMHFGQPMRLNGANLAWSRDAHYARDVGTDYVDIRAFKDRFAQIAAAGGNSARWWMHTNGTITPNIDHDGQVLGLSTQLTNQQVIEQVRSILDAAWAEGILLNITLFSFDLMCQQDRLGAHSAMLNRHSQTYIDNALAPLVSGLKDHPALLAWEIFNESEGMATGTSFFGDPNLQDCTAGRAQPTWVFQRFVNHAAARIHAIDPNVKVTTSVGHPVHLKDYTNDALLGQSFSRPGGDLDFYQIHWYSEDYNPFMKSAPSYRLDRPIVVGEYGPLEEQDAKRLFDNGYAGAWMWSQTSESRAAVSRTIESGKVCAPRVDKQAVRACLRSKSANCYK